MIARARLAPTARLWPYEGTEPFVAYPFRGRRVAGLIDWPFFRKSRGKFAGSDGEVRRISAFVIARRCFKSARLRLGPSGWRAVNPRRLLVIAHPHFTIIITYDIFVPSRGWP
jgi:hypothetical protein